MRSANIKIAKEILDVLDRYSMSIVGIYELNGDYQAEIEFYSDLGEDVLVAFWFDGTGEDFIAQFRSYAYDYDPDEHAELNGVPRNARDLIEDAEAIGDLLDDVSDRLNDLDVDGFEDEEGEGDYDESYRKLRRPSRIKTERFNRKPRKRTRR